MTSAFIIQVQPQLQPDTGEETTALLRVLIYKIDNTTFGGNTPALPQWSGPPHAIIQVQAILYASLAASLFSAFLAMLGKQWLNRYASIDMRGSAVERSQNRQRKLDGVIAWYFDNVMEALPLMLQFALLLLGGALSRFLWEINTTVALVILGIASFGVAFYIFILIAGTTSVSCPYQTPGARFLRHIPPLVLSMLRSISSYSQFFWLFTMWWDDLRGASCSASDIAHLLTDPLLFPFLLVIDAFILARAIFRAFVAIVRRVRDGFRGVRGLDPQTALDLRCMAWMLQTSLDKTIHLSILKLLASMTTLTNFDPALVSACFDILAGCVSIVGVKAVIAQGTEELAVESVLCCIRALSHPGIIDPASGVFKDVKQRYTVTFPIGVNFEGLPSYHRFCMIHNIFHPYRKWSNSQQRYLYRPKIQWEDYKPSSTERIVLVQFARFGYQKSDPHKVPRWIIRFAHHILSQDPLPRASIASDCLSVLAMDLGCAVSDATTLDERYVHVCWISIPLTKFQYTAGGDFEPDN